MGNRINQVARWFEWFQKVPKRNRGRPRKDGIWHTPGHTKPCPACGDESGNIIHSPAQTQKERKDG